MGVRNTPALSSTLAGTRVTTAAQPQVCKSQKFLGLGNIYYWSRIEHLCYTFFPLRVTWVRRKQRNETNNNNNSKKKCLRLPSSAETCWAKEFVMFVMFVMFVVQTKVGFLWSTGAVLYERVQVWLEFTSNSLLDTPLDMEFQYDFSFSLRYKSSLTLFSLKQPLTDKCRRSLISS